MKKPFWAFVGVGYMPTFTFASHLGGLGDKPTHDTSLKDVVAGSSDFVAGGVSILAIFAVFFGVLLFIFSVIALRKKDKLGESLLGLFVSAFLAIALTLFGFWVGFANYMGGGWHG